MRSILISCWLIENNPYFSSPKLKVVTTLYLLHYFFNLVSDTIFTYFFNSMIIEYHTNWPVGGILVDRMGIWFRFALWILFDKVALRFWSQLCSLCPLWYLLDTVVIRKSPVHGDSDKDLKILYACLAQPHLLIQLCLSLLKSFPCCLLMGLCKSNMKKLPVSKQTSLPDHQGIQAAWQHSKKGRCLAPLRNYPWSNTFRT